MPATLAERIKGDELAATPDFKAFLGKMHEAGLSQKQLDVVAGELLERSVKLQEGMPVLAAADCEADLRKADGWKTDAEYAAKTARAFQAGKAYGGADFAGIEKDYGNDPRIVRLLAAVGAEMQEDQQASPEAMQQVSDTLDALMNSKAYLNRNDPQHAGTVAKVNALQARKTGSRQVVTGKSMSFNT